MESYTADGGITTTRSDVLKTWGGGQNFQNYTHIVTLTLTKNSTMNAYNINNLLKITRRFPLTYQIDYLPRLFLGRKLLMPY